MRLLEDDDPERPSAARQDDRPAYPAPRHASNDGVISMSEQRNQPGHKSLHAALESRALGKPHFGSLCED